MQIYSQGNLITLTEEQERLVELAVREFNMGSKLFQYSAPAGCGKSVVLHAIVEQLGLTEDQIAPMAYMGSASMVMRKNGFSTAKTCHSWLYEPRTKQKLNPYTNKIQSNIDYVKRKLPPEIELIVIDEGSMVPDYIKEVIDWNKRPVLVCGDLNQLPPIDGESAYLNNTPKTPVYTLSQIMRQDVNSEIVQLSRKLLEGIDPVPGQYGNQVIIIDYSDLTKDMLLSADVVITATNKTREYFISKIRNYLGYHSQLPQYGEKVVCRENKWNIEVDGINPVNGMSGICKNLNWDITQLDPETSKATFNLDFSPTMFPDITFNKLKCDYQYFISDQVTRRKIKEMEEQNPYIPSYNKFEFGYAVTTHMSQGNQFDTGIFIEESLRSSDSRKLKYTGITRFAKKCIYVVSKKRFHSVFNRVFFPSVQIPATVQEEITQIKHINNNLPSLSPPPKEETKPDKNKKVVMSFYGKPVI